MNDLELSAWNQRKTYFTALLLIGILLCGWFLRTAGLDWGLPFRLHPDEMKYVAPAARVYQGEWNPGYFRNPPGFSYLTALWYPFWMPIRPVIEVPEWMGISPVLLQPQNSVPATLHYRPFDLVLGARHLAALLGTVTVLLVFLIGWEIGGLKVALAAAVLHSVSFIGVRESHFAVNDTAMTFFVTLCLWVGFLANRHNSRWLLCIAGGLAGVSVAMKYNAFPMVGALIVLRFIHYYQKPERIPWLAWVLETVGVVVLSVVFFLLICPFPLTDPQTFWAEIDDLARKSSQTWPGQETTWSGFLLVESLFASEGVLGVVLAVIGFVLFVRNRRWNVLVFPLLYILLVSSHSLYFMRFALPILPWLALGVAAAIIWVSDRLTHSQSQSRIITILVLLLTLVEPSLKDFRSNYLFNQTDTRIEFLCWLRTENQAPVRIAVDQYCIPFLYRGVSETWSTLFDPRLVPIDHLDSNDLKQLDSFTDVPVGQIAVSSFAAFPGFLPDTYEQRREALMNHIGAEGPVKTFQPFVAEWRSRASDVEDTYNPVTDLWKRKKPGPVIEVFGKVVGSDE